MNQYVSFVEYKGGVSTSNIGEGKKMKKSELIKIIKESIISELEN